MNEKELKIFKMRAEIAQAIGHPIRMAIVDFLKDGEKCVCEISERLKSQRSNISRHLSVLQKAGLISGRKDGLWMRYSLPHAELNSIIGSVDDIVRKRLNEDLKVLEKLG